MCCPVCIVTSAAVMAAAGATTSGGLAALAFKVSRWGKRSGRDQEKLLMIKLSDHEIVSHAEWSRERKTLLAKEKEFNRLRDELSAKRRELPWERVTKRYARSRDARAALRRAHTYAPAALPFAELSGLSVFYRDLAADQVFHTYSTYSRGLDMLNVGYHYLDLVPKGRNEEETNNRPTWLRRWDEYAGSPTKGCH